jgi:glyceraldehyde 3-phosphate dehydrogenase
MLPMTATTAAESTPTSLAIGINGFGRMGRLAFRVACEDPALRVARINDPAGDAAAFAHLLNFDSVHGRWHREARAEGDMLVVGERRIPVSRERDIAATDWSGCEVVIEASGKFRSQALLAPYLAQGVRRVVVTAPVKEPGALDVVVGVNHALFDPATHRVVSAASCTTNCLAPLVKVIHEGLGIRHGSLTTIHSLTNTQTIVDATHKDPRRARSCGDSLIPTSTGSATAIAEIFPALRGKLDGLAVRVPLTNASLTDAVFEVERATSVDEVNGMLRAAAEGPLAGVLGFEARPLVSIDFRTDPRSAIVDAACTRVVGGTQVKLYAWYDNEWGYVNRTVELVRLVGGLPPRIGNAGLPPGIGATGLPRHAGGLG